MFTNQEQEDLNTILNQLLRTQVYRGQRRLYALCAPEKVEPPRVQLFLDPTVNEWVLYDPTRHVILLNYGKLNRLLFTDGRETVEVVLSGIILGSLIKHHYSWSDERVAEVTMQLMLSLFPHLRKVG